MCALFASAPLWAQAPQAPTQGLVAHYRFDNSFADEMGNNPNAIRGTAPNWPSSFPPITDLVKFDSCGVRNQCLRVVAREVSWPHHDFYIYPAQHHLNGSRMSCAVEFPLTADSLNLNRIMADKKSFTLSFWAKPHELKEDNNSNTAVMGKTSTFWVDSVDVGQFRTRLDRTLSPSGAFIYRMMSTIQRPLWVPNSFPNTDSLSINCWFHYTISREVTGSGSGQQAVFKTYRNGVLVNSITYTASSPIYNIPITVFDSVNQVHVENTFKIAGEAIISPHKPSPSFLQPFNGFIDELRVYDRALSDAEVAQVYAADDDLYFPDPVALYCPNQPVQIEPNRYICNTRYSWNAAPGLLSNNTIINPLANSAGTFTFSYEFGQEAHPSCVRTRQVTVLSGSAGPTLEKTVNTSQAIFGDTLTYTLRVCNPCAAPLDSLLLRDSLPQGLAFLSGNGLLAYNANNHSLSALIPSLAGGTCLDLSYQAQVLVEPQVCTSAAIPLQNCAVVQDKAELYPPATDCALVSVSSLPACTPNPNRVSFERLIAAGILLPQASSASQAQTLYVSGTLELTTATADMLNPYTFAAGSLIKMKPGAQLVLETDTYLALDGATLEGCDCLWKGILVNKFAFLKTSSNTNIRDAQYAVELRSDALLTLTQTNFLNNFVGVYLPPAPPQGTNPQHLTLNSPWFLNNSFAAPSLKPPFTGISPTPGYRFPSIFIHNLLPLAQEKGLAGIYVHDLQLLDVSPNPNLVGASGRNHNTFRDLTAGLISIQSNIDLAHFDMRDITSHSGYPSDLVFQGVGVYSGSFQQGQHTAKVMKHTSYTSQRMTMSSNIDRGFVSFAGNFQVQDVRMLGINQIGISSSFGQNCIMVAEQNEIRTRRTGIFMALNEPSDGLGFNLQDIRVLAQDNLTSFELSSGLLVLEQGGGHNNQPFFSNSLIRTDSAYFGIMALGATGHRFEGNQVTMPLARDIQFGMAFLDLSDVEVFCNQINPDSSTAADNRDSTYAGTYGFYGERMTGDFACNSTSLTKTGAVFADANSIQLQGTQFGHHHTGLHILSNAYIGGQPWHGNRWLGTYTDFAARNDNTNPTQSEFQVDNTAPPSGVWPSLILPSSTWFNFQSGSNYDCNDFMFCGIPLAARAASSTSLSSANLSPMQAGSSNFASATQAYVAERQLYRRLQAEAAQGRLSSAQSTYLQQQAQGDAGLMEDLAQSQAQALRGGASAYQARQDYRLFREQAATAWRANDSALLANPASAQAWQNRLALAQDAETQYQNLAQVQQQVLQQRQVSLQQLMQQNGSLRLQAPAAQADQVVNGIYWASLAQASFGFSAQDLLSLRLIADDCPEQLGPAVYRARALLHVHDGTAIWRPSACAPIARRSAQASSSEPSSLQSSEFRLYPNPVTQLVTLVLPQGLSGQMQLHCYNSLGQLLRQAQLEASSSSLDYSLQDLAPGLYYLQLRQGEKTWTASLRVQ